MINEIILKKLRKLVNVDIGEYTIRVEVEQNDDCEFFIENDKNSYRFEFYKNNSFYLGNLEPYTNINELTIRTVEVKDGVEFITQQKFKLAGKDELEINKDYIKLYVKTEAYLEFIFCIKLGGKNEASSNNRQRQKR